MIRLRSALASIYVFALLAIAASAAAQTTEPNWQLLDVPDDGVTASSEGGPVTRHIYLLHNEAGINESPLPDIIKEDLVPPQDPSGGISVSLEDGGEAVYAVSQEIVDGIVASENAGVLTPEIDAISEPLDEETSYASGGAVGNSIFGGSCATKQQTIHRVINLTDKTYTKNFPDLGNGFSGSISLTGQITGTVTADLTLDIKRRNTLGKCVPYSVRFKNLHAFGDATSSGGITLTGTINYSDTFGPWPIANPVLFEYWTTVYYIPVKIGGSLPVTAGLSVTADVTGTINYNGNHVATGNFDYNCTLSDCTGTHSFNNSPDNLDQQITGGITGHIKPDAWVDAAFRVYLYSAGFAHAQVGVRGHLLGDLWGFDGNNCGDADGADGNETVRALTFDLDRRIDILGKAEVFGDNVWDHTISTGDVVHVGFYDLINSTAMQPQLHGPASLDKRDPGEYKVRMRPCWPYTDPVKYRLNWGDGSAVQELQGAPATEVTASHTWDTAGNKTVTANSWKDDHGRTLDQTTSRTIEVKEPAPLDVTVTPSPVSATYGTTITWTATATGGHPASTQYALFRRLAGATAWIPDVTAPSWQTSNVLSWTPSPAETGVWEIIVWVKDRNTAADANTYGFADYANAGNVQVVPPLVLSCPASTQRTVTSGNPTTWTVSSVGGTPGTIQYTLSRNPVGTANYAPLAWQEGNVLSWTPAAAEIGTWQVSALAKDLNTPANPGYTSYCNLGQVTVVAPISLSVTPSPAQSVSGSAITWTATATGGTPSSMQYALFRRLAGTTAWTPDVTAPSWQAGNTLTWTPGSADTGTWEIVIWVKDGNTPANMNTYGYAAYANAGPVQVVTPLSLTVTPTPFSRPYDDSRLVSWTATASGGVPSTYQYAFFRRRAGATAWIPDVTAPNWQTSNSYSAWDPTAADVGTWEIYVWVKDSATPANMNTYGYGAGYNPGTITVTAPMCLSSTASPAYVSPGTALTWTATACGGYPGTTEYALFRRRAGTTTWTPATPAWQSSNVLTWTPTSADTGTWEISLWVRDDDTPASPGYGATYNPGNVQIVAPISVTGTGSPSYSPYGTTMSWTANASGGDSATYRYAFFRRRAGTTPWTPDVTAPAWQASNVMSWTPTSADTGTWEIIIWVKDGNTPATMNTYGFAAYYNAGPVQIVTPISVTGTGSPATSLYGTTLNWTATASGGVPSTYRYAFFRRRAGTTPWTPDVTAPNWQTSNVMSWTPASADAGTWETYVWVKDASTPATMNTYGYAAGYNPGPVRVAAPISGLVCSGSSSGNYGTTFTWTCTVTGGDAPTLQYALFRRRAGATSWTPAITAPSWQSSNVFTWTSTSADVGTWELLFWVKDANTPPNQNTYGYAASYTLGSVQVLTPLSVTGTGSPTYSTYGTTITWTASISGGTGTGGQYAFFRRRAGTTPWTPDVTTPAWQTSNVMSWTPSSADTGTWEIIIWAKDSSTPSTMNTYGYAAYYNAGPVQVVSPVSLSGTSSPSAVYTGTSISWTLSASGGVPSTRQYAFFRRRAGTTPWTPDVTAPGWTTSNTFTWTPSSTDTGTWEIIFWIKDASTKPGQNTYTYSAYYNAGPVQVVTPPTVSGSGSPSSAYYGPTLTWTANVSGGTGTGIRYAFFRRRAGTTPWTPDVTAAAWQTSNTMSWTPTSSDVGTWEIIIWAKDSATPSNMNTYGYATYYNAGPVQIVAPAPLTVSGTGSPSTSPAGTTLTWTANASGGVPSTIKYALFRRLAGTSNWIPDVTAPAWQSSNVLRWTPSSADVGTWEIIIWVKDINTSPTQNTYGFAAYYNAQPVQVY